MRKFALYFGFFALAAIVSAVLPAMARADRVASAHVQVRDNLGRAIDSTSGDSEDVSALLEFVRNPQSFVPARLAARQPLDPSETLDKRKVAENIGKHVPAETVRVYKNKTVLVPDDGVVWIPMGTFHKEVIQVEGSLDDSAN